MRLKNIAQVVVFTELVCKKLPTSLQRDSIIDNIANKRSFSLRMLSSPKYNEKTKKHVHVKKTMHPKNETIFDFMICLPNDESEITESPLLIVPESEIGRCSNINNITTDAEFELVKTLL